MNNDKLPVKRSYKKTRTREQQRTKMLHQIKRTTKRGTHTEIARRSNQSSKTDPTHLSWAYSWYRRGSNYCCTQVPSQPSCRRVESCPAIAPSTCGRRSPVYRDSSSWKVWWIRRLDDEDDDVDFDELAAAPMLATRTSTMNQMGLKLHRCFVMKSEWSV